MLDEIRLFFEKLREEPAPAWPEGGVSVIGPDGGDLRAESEQHWRLAMEAADKMVRAHSISSPFCSRIHDPTP